MTTVTNVKRAQKESVLLRLISQLFLQAGIDDPQLRGLFVNRVTLSPDKSICTVYFYTPEGKKYFDEKLPLLKLYKPSMRKAVAREMHSRYAVDLVFKFDDQFERQAKIEALIESVSKKDPV